LVFVIYFGDPFLVAMPVFVAAVILPYLEPFCPTCCHVVNVAYGVGCDAVRFRFLHTPAESVCSCAVLFISSVNRKNIASRVLRAAMDNGPSVWKVDGQSHPHNHGREISI